MASIAQIRELVAPIAREYGVKRVYLFGSQATGRARADSDVDLLIEKGGPMSLLKLSGMRQRCQDVLKLPVDLITTAGIASDFRKEISGTEVLLYEE